MRLWHCGTGQLLAEVAVHAGPVNSLAFDAVGKRLYTGDGKGVLKELSVDVGHSKSRSHPGDTRLRVNVKLLRSGTGEALPLPVTWDTGGREGRGRARIYRLTVYKRTLPPRPK